MSPLARFLDRLSPHLASMKPLDRLRISAGAVVGIFLTGWISTLAVGTPASLPLLIAPMGASAVLLFAAPTSPLAQPWSIIGGNTIGALVGITAAWLIPHPVVAAAVAAGAAIGVMLLLGCLHPPGGAVALTAVLGGPAIHQAGYWFALSPVAVNSALLTLVAVLFNNLTGRRYPHRPPPPAAARLDPAGGSGLGIVPADLKAVLDDYGEIVNLTPDDLEDLLHQAQIRAFTRRSGEVTCGEIMSRDVVRVAPSTGLRQAWLILLEARIKALPVVTEAQGLVGIVTQSDFMRAAVLDEDRRIALSLSGRLRHAFGFEARAPLTVADIMTTRVQSALASTRIASIVPPKKTWKP